jgi:hypothetical protein
MYDTRAEVSVATSPAIMTPSEAAAYAERLSDVVADFEVLGHGSRLQASLDIGVASSRVSGVLKHRGIDEALLDQLATWARAERTRRNV